MKKPKKRGKPSGLELTAMGKGKKALSVRSKAEKKLRESEARYRALVDSTEDSIYLVDSNYIYLFMNKKHLLRLRLSKSRLGSTTYSELHSAEESKEFKKKVNRVFRTGKSSQYEYLSKRDNRYFLQTFSPVRDKNKKIVAVTVVSKDITERKYAQEALKESEERFRALFNQASDSIFLLKPSKKGLIIADTNYAACESHGYSYKELIGKPIAFLDDKESRKKVKERTIQLTQGKPMTFEAMHVRKYGGTFPVEVSAQLISIGEEPYVLAIDRDISERKRFEKELHDLSLKDDLTGLYNRRGCITLGGQLLKIAARDGRGLYMLYADVDGLKEINDKQGHSEGDRALMDIAQVLKENYRESDLVARIGGDEFVVIPVGFAGDSEDGIRDRLHKTIDKYLISSKRRYRLSMSVGIAYFDPRERCSIDELIDRADKLMYKEKKSRKKKKRKRPITESLFP